MASMAMAMASMAMASIVVISGGGDGGAPAGGKPPLNKINLLRHPRRPPPAPADKKEHTNHNDGLSVC